jgi:uncharacterized SAM-binding protein YcdF (DUF218 family)
MLQTKKMRRFWQGVILGILIALLAWIPVRLAIAHFQAPAAQAIFVLGGGFDRTEQAARLWQANQNLAIWVSDFEVYFLQHYFILKEAGVPDAQIKLDNRAVDTVTNFTTLVSDLTASNVKHVTLVTSDFHMRRSIAIGTLVFGSRGIWITPVRVDSADPDGESLLHAARDAARATLWLATGKTGAVFHTPKVARFRPKAR